MGRGKGRGEWREDREVKGSENAHLVCGGETESLL